MSYHKLQEPDEKYYRIQATENVKATFCFWQGWVQKNYTLFGMEPLGINFELDRSCIVKQIIGDIGM